MRSGEVSFLYDLARDLKTPVHVLRTWPLEEINGWVAYFKAKKKG